MGRKRKSNKIAKVHPELQGLDLTINEFGEIKGNVDIKRINEFLTKNVPDKKLMFRRDDAYQQEFKEELAKEGKLQPEEEDDIAPFVEDTDETSEDDELTFLNDDDEDDKN